MPFQPLAFFPAGDRQVRMSVGPADPGQMLAKSLAEMRREDFVTGLFLKPPIKDRITHVTLDRKIGQGLHVAAEQQQSLPLIRLMTVDMVAAGGAPAQGESHNGQQPGRGEPGGRAHGEIGPGDLQQPLREGFHHRIYFSIGDRTCLQI